MSSRDNGLESKDRKGLNVRSDVPAVLDPQELAYTGYDDYKERSGSNFEESYESSNFDEASNRNDEANFDRQHQRFRPSQFQERHGVADLRNDHGVEHEVRHGQARGEQGDATMICLQ